MGLGELGQTIILMMSVIIGFVVSMAATGSIGNALSGLVIYGFKPIEKGDVVSLTIGSGDVVTGTITNIDLMFTTMIDLESQEVRIPNNDVLSYKLVNHTKSGIQLYYSKVYSNGGYGLKYDNNSGNGMTQVYYNNISANTAGGVFVSNAYGNIPYMSTNNFSGNGGDAITVVNWSGNPMRITDNNFTGTTDHDVSLVDSYVWLYPYTNISSYNFTSSRVQLYEAGTFDSDIILYFPDVTANGTGISSGVDLSYNHVFINSTTQPGLNTTANITMVGFAENWSDVAIEMDVDGDGVYEANCTNETDPTCYNFSTYSKGSSYIFNTSHFTAFRLVKAPWNGCGQIVYEDTTVTSNMAGTNCISFGGSNISFVLGWTGCTEFAPFRLNFLFLNFFACSSICSNCPNSFLFFDVRLGGQDSPLLSDIYRQIGKSLSFSGG